MAVDAGSRGNRRDSTVQWTCDHDCWCHIPVRGVTPPPCYQCVLSHCSLSCKPDYIASAPELPLDDAYFLTQNQASVVAAGRDRISASAEAAGGRTETLASLTLSRDPPHNNSHIAISATPEASHIRYTEHNQAFTPVTTIPTVSSLVTPRATPPATPSRQDSPHQSHNSGSSRHSPYEDIEGADGGSEVVSSRLVFLEPQSSNWSFWDTLIRNDNSLIPRTNALVSPDTHSQTNQSLVCGNLMVDNESPNQTSLALSSGIRNVILRGDETVNCEIEDSKVASCMPITEQRSSPSLTSSCDISSMESTSRHLDSNQSTEGDLSTRLKWLILGSEDGELPQANSNEQSKPLASTNWTVNARGLTVCSCGDMHRCNTKKHSRTPTFKRKNQSSQAAHRPRYSVMSEVRGTNPSRPHSASTPREHEFRNINRITSRESSRDAARRYLHNVIKQ